MNFNINGEVESYLPCDKVNANSKKDIKKLFKTNFYTALILVLFPVSIAVLIKIRQGRYEYLTFHNAIYLMAAIFIVFLLMILAGYSGYKKGSEYEFISICGNTMILSSYIGSSSRVSSLVLSVQLDDIRSIQLNEKKLVILKKEKGINVVDSPIKYKNKLDRIIFSLDEYQISEVRDLLDKNGLVYSNKVERRKFSEMFILLFQTKFIFFVVAPMAFFAYIVIKIIVIIL